MKYVWSILAFSTFLLFGCSTETSPDRSADDDTTESVTPFNVSFDMTTEEVRDLYSDYDFRCAEPNHYGLCGGGEAGFEVLRNDTVLFCFWDQWENTKVGSFILLDPKQSYMDIHVGMNLNDYLKKHPKAKTVVSHLDSKEYIPFDNGNCWFKLAATDEENYAAEYRIEHGEYQFVSYIDTDKKIESIFVKKPN